MKCTLFLSLLSIKIVASTVGDWSDWSGCSLTCGIGVQTRHRGVEPDHEKQSQTCLTKSCQASAPATWKSTADDLPDSFCQTICKPDSMGSLPAACVADSGRQKCAPAAQASSVEVKVSEQIPMDATVIQQYIPAEIPVKFLEGTDCYGTWGTWGVCSKACGGGLQSHTFSISVPASPLGKRCSFRHGEVETKSCNEEPCTAERQQQTQELSAPQTPCQSLAPEVTDLWCVRNCISDSMGNLPTFCKSNPVTPLFQKCSCDSDQFGCWSTTPSVPNSWCSSTCTTVDPNGDLHPACRPGPFQECSCRFQSLPADLRPPVSFSATAQAAQNDHAAQQAAQAQAAPKQATGSTKPTVLIPGQGN
eukprot:GGOE01019463.1.p1 GENE.GGOE01019463.1~~GGOE01019463.1.p1  ORF type:complete len:362 (-),score=23.26 GGOE01019463.1:232-1317(-)